MNSFFEEIGFTYNIETDEWERYTNYLIIFGIRC